MTKAPCTRTDKAVRWVVGHAAELTGITVLATLAIVLAVWVAALAVGLAAWWITHEIRDNRRQRKIRELRAAADRRWLATTQGTTNPPIEHAPRKAQP